MDDPTPLDVRADELIGIIGRLNDSLMASNDRLDVLTAASKHNHRLIRVLAVSIVFDVLLSLGLAFALSRSSQAADNARQAAAANKASIHATCLATNDSRARTIQLWNYVLTLNPATTAEAQARAGQLQAFVNETFKARDCDAPATP